MILLEGNLKSIKQVQAAASIGIPVIIIKGSGNAADTIFDYFERYDKDVRV